MTKAKRKVYIVIGILHGGELTLPIGIYTSKKKAEKVLASPWNKNRYAALMMHEYFLR